jgi:hypothetical protein
MNISTPKVGVENKMAIYLKNGSYGFDYFSVFMETI